MVEEPETTATDVGGTAAGLQVGIGLLVRRLRQLPVHGDLSLPERAALSRLERVGPATASDLARAQQITPQATSVTLAGLEDRGLVERRPDPADGRRVTVSVTPAGHEALRNKRNAQTQRLATALTEGFTAAEVATLAATVPLLERLAERL